MSHTGDSFDSFIIRRAWSLLPSPSPLLDEILSFFVRFQVSKWRPRLWMCNIEFPSAMIHVPLFFLRLPILRTVATVEELVSTTSTAAWPTSLLAPHTNTLTRLSCLDCSTPVQCLDVDTVTSDGDAFSVHLKINGTHYYIRSVISHFTSASAQRFQPAPAPFHTHTKIELAVSHTILFITDAL